MKRILILALCTLLLFATVFAVKAQPNLDYSDPAVEAAILDAMAKDWLITCDENAYRCQQGLEIYCLGQIQFLSEDAAREIYVPLRDGQVDLLTGAENVKLRLNFDNIDDAIIDEYEHAFWDGIEASAKTYCSFTDVQIGTPEWEAQVLAESNIFSSLKDRKYIDDITLMDFIKENYAFMLGKVSAIDAGQCFRSALTTEDLSTKRKLMLMGASMATFSCEMSIENADEIVKAAYTEDEIKFDREAQIEIIGNIANNAVDVVGKLVPEIAIAMDAITITTDIALKTLSMSGKLSALAGFMTNPDTIEQDINGYYNALSNQYGKFTFEINDDFEIVLNEYNGYLQIPGIAQDDKGLPDYCIVDLDTIHYGFPVVAFDGVFANNVDITQITIPRSIRSRSLSNVINDCDKLQKVYYNAPNCEGAYIGYFFNNCDSDFEVVFADDIEVIPERFIAKCGITSITFPEGVKTINSGALVDCPNLKTVTIPSSVEQFEMSLAAHAIVENCGKLETVYYNAIRPEGSYYNAVFSGCGNDAEEMQLIFGDNIDITPVFFLDNCGVKSVIFPEGMTQIREQAIQDCEKLETITIPSTVTGFSDNFAVDYVFSQCNNLKKVNYNAPNAAGEVGVFIFHDIQSDFEVHFGPQIESIPENFMTKCGLSAIAFPEGVKTIHNNCLIDCDDLKTVEVPSTVEMIEYNFLKDCGSVEDVYFNANCTTSSHSALISNCGDFTDPVMTVHLGKNVTTVPANFIENCSIRDFVYPEGIQVINSDSLVKCSALETVVIPSTVKQFDYPVVSNCGSLKTIEYNAQNAVNVDDYSYLINSSGDADGLEICFAENIQSLPSRLMYECSVHSVTFPKSLAKIPERAFYKCADLTLLTIPQNITAIGNEAFGACTGLTEIRFYAIAMNDLRHSNGVFSDAGEDGTGITVVIGNETTKIPANLFCPYYTFNGDPKITKVQFGTESVCTSIGEYAFGYCANLPAVEIPRSVITIDEAAFYKCTGLTNVTLAYGLKTIGDTAFYGCKSLPGFVIPDSVTTLGEGVFSDCTALTNVTIGGGLTTISAKTFNGCTGLPGIAIPGNITDIEYSAFSGCTGLMGITLQNSIAAIESNAFNDCDNLTSVIYCGTVLQWRQVDITNYGNTDFQNAKLQYHNWVDHPDTGRQVCSICNIFVCEPTAHTYVAEVTAPTCLEDGYTTYICSTCGHIYEGNRVGATGHSFKNSICSVCGARGLIQWVGTQVQATSNLDMQFALRIADLGGTTGNYIELTRTYIDGTTDVVIIEQSDWTVSGNFYIVAYSGIAAKEMGDVIEAVVYNAEGNAISEVRAESIETYALSMLGKITNPEQKTMFVDLLNYGAEAQKYFHHNEAHLVNSGLTEEQKSWATQSDVEVTDNRVKDETVYGTQLSLENVVLLQAAFNPALSTDNGTCETAQELADNIIRGWNLGCSLSVVSKPTVSNFYGLIGMSTDDGQYSRSEYLNFDDKTSSVTLDWNLDTDGILNADKGAMISKIFVEQWNFALTEADYCTFTVKEFTYTLKSGEVVSLTDKPITMQTNMSGGTGYIPLAELDELQGLQVKDIKSMHCVMSFGGMNVGETTPEKIATQETAWGNPVTTQEMIDAVVDRGFNLIRIQVSYLNHMDAEGNIDELWLDRVQEVVDYCMNAGVYCVINTSGYMWMTCNPADWEVQKPIYTNLWKQISERFADYGEKLIFESCNEILYREGLWNYPPAEAYDVMHQIHQTFVDTVRAGGGYNETRNLMLNPYAAGYDYEMNKNFTLPTDTVEGHLLAQVHCYVPQDFTFNETNLGSTNFRYEWGTAQDKWQLDGILQGIKKRFIDELGIPVVIGEFGVAKRLSESEAAEYIGFYAEIADKYDIQLILFDDGLDIAVFDRNNLTWTRPQVVETLFAEDGSAGVSTVKAAADAATTNPMDGMTAKVTYTNYRGVSITETAQVEDSNGFAIVSVDSLAFADYETLVTITLYNADGTVAGTVSDSMASYAARANNTLAKALMKFCASAYAYFM